MTKGFLPAALLALALPVAAVAQSPMTGAELFAPMDVLGLSASASVEVTRDLLSVALTTSREGSDAAAVQAQLKQALDAALAEAKRVAKPGQVDVQTGNFSLYPRYNQKGAMAGWHGTAELIVEGRDAATVGQLVGRITSMTVGRVSQGLSREARERSEAEVAGQAITAYRAKAAEYARQFGYAGYALREVTVGASEPPGPPIPMMRATAATMEAAPLPVEAGKATVTVTVSGTVRLTR
jgi:predicted secreted protein